MKTATSLIKSTRAVTKVDGTILEQNDYYPFGLRTTRGENYSTLSESLAAIAQNANNTTANTVVPEYLYNGKEKQDFIKNSSAVINAGGSTDYTSNYIDYGARFYNPTTIRWNTQDPMAEKYQRFSPYNYCVNDPISLVDPNGEDLYLTGDLAQMAFEQLQEQVKEYITLGIDKDGKVTYSLNEGVKRAKRNAKKIAKIIDDDKIEVQVETTKEMYNDKHELLSGGAFMGTMLSKEQKHVTTKQLVNPLFFEYAENKGKIKKGTFIMHEITESYIAGHISLTSQENAERSIEGKDNPIYKQAHLEATNQPAIQREMYDSMGNKTYSIALAVSIEYSIKRKTFLDYMPRKSKKVWH